MYEGDMIGNYDIFDKSKLLRPEHDVVLMVFNMGGTLLSFITAMCKGWGWGGDFGCFYFWASLDPYDQTLEEPFEGVRFETDHPLQVTISYDDAYYYMKLAYPKYVQRHPESEQELLDLFKEYRQRYNIQE